MNSLPESVIRHILQYATWKDLYFLQHTNKEWNATLEQYWQPILESFPNSTTNCWMHVEHLFEQSDNPNALKEQIINTWGTVVKAYQKNYSWQGLSLQVPDTINLGIYDYNHVRSPLLRQYANCSVIRELVENSPDYDPTIELDSCKTHTLWDKEVLISCMDPPYGCETYYVGREAWAKWFGLDGFILAIPIYDMQNSDPNRVISIQNHNADRVRQFYAQFSSPQMQDIGGNTHSRKEIRKEKEDCKTPIVLVGYYTNNSPRIANTSHSEQYIQLAEELKVPYIEIYKHTTLDSIHVFQLLILEMAREYGWYTKNKTKSKTNVRNCSIS